MNALFKRVISHPLVWTRGIANQSVRGMHRRSGYVIVKLLPELHLEREELAALNEIVPANVGQRLNYELHISSGHPNLVELLAFLDMLEVAVTINRRTR